MPALLTSSVTSAQARAAPATSSGLVTSSLIGTPPASVTLAGSRAAAYTLRAPRASASRANARPRPRLAPVIRTTALSSFMAGFRGGGTIDEYDGRHIRGLEKAARRRHGGGAGWSGSVVLPVGVLVAASVV